MANIPAEIHRVLAAHLTPRELLLFRATCRAFRRVAPIESILPGFQQDTLRWTVHGINTEWNHHMDTAGLRVRYRALPLGVDVAAGDLADPRVGDGTAYARTDAFGMFIRKFDGNFVAYASVGDGLPFRLCLERPWPLIHDRMLCAVEYFEDAVYLVTRALHLFVIPVRPTDVEMAAAYEHALAQPPAKKLEMRGFTRGNEALPLTNSVKRCLYQENGDLWILTDIDGTRDDGKVIWVHDGAFELVRSHVVNIHVQDDVVFMLCTNGTMLTRGTDGVTRRIDAFGDGRIVAFAVTLDLRCMWVRFDSEVLIRRGEPFLLPVGEAEDDRKESVALLRAKLARAERRIARLLTRQ